MRRMQVAVFAGIILAFAAVIALTSLWKGEFQAEAAWFLTTMLPAVGLVLLASDQTARRGCRRCRRSPDA